MGEDSLLERVTAAAEERHLSQNTLTAYRRTWLKLIGGRQGFWSKIPKLGRTQLSEWVVHTHKGPRDYPKAYSYSCCKKSSTLHGRVVLFERILVWFVELITHKGSRAEGHPGRSCRNRENSEPCSHAAPERRANHNHRVLRHQSGASRSTSEITTTQRCRRYSLGRMLVSRRKTCAKWLGVEMP